MFEDLFIEKRSITDCICGHCGHVNPIVSSFDVSNFVKSKEYLDGSREDMREYFDKKEIMCENCHNVGNSLEYDAIKNVNADIVQDIIKSVQSNIEQKLLIAYHEFPNYYTALDLYYYYDMHKNLNERNRYANLCIEFSKNMINYQLYDNVIVVIADIYRRMGMFEKVRSLYKNINKLYLINLKKHGSNTQLKNLSMLQKELMLCKNGDIEKHFA